MLLEIEKDNLLYGRAYNFCYLQERNTTTYMQVAQSDLLRRREITDIKRKDLSFIANI